MYKNVNRSVEITGSKITKQNILWLMQSVKDN